VGRAGGATRVVVNDRVDVAVAAGAVGAHLRADGPPAAAVRALVPRPWLLGRSVHSTTEARAAAETDYLVFGTVFASASKPPDAPVAGPAALQQTVREAAVPVLAIGGITAARAAACRAAGAAGLAAIGIFLPRGRAPGALGPSAAVAALRSGWLDPSGW